MIGYDINALVPAFIRSDHNGKAMAKAIDRGMKLFCEVCLEGVNAVTDAGEMPEWRLDEYAWEMGAEWYDSTASLEEKRAQIRAISDVYRKLGTLQSLTDAATSLFGADCFVNEWFSYNGQPYHYKVVVTTDQSVDTARAMFMRLAGIVTPVRSVMDSLQFRGAKGSTQFYTKTGTQAVSGSWSATAALGKNKYDTAVLGVGMLGVMVIGKGDEV